jgi:hypothetical protein
MAVAEHHIRESVARYLSDQMSLLDFQTWFVPRAWEILETGTPAAAVAAQLELLLAEFTSGDLTEDELREAFTPYGSVAMLGQSSIDLAWEIATSAQSVSLRLHDLPQTEPVWWRISEPKEAQAA